MGHEDELRKNLRIEQEFSNPVYDVVGKAISYTAEKYNYGKFDIAKLVMALYAEDYGYLTADEDYRQQVKMLSAYFEKEYNHKLITFELVKTIKRFQGNETYDTLTTDIAELEATIRSGKAEHAENLCLFSEPLEDGEYNELMQKIECESSLRYAVAIVYDKIKNKGK